ncbi:MAG: helix-turn-helix domain-containing protein [Balneolaceae bacterium]|nr:helix-turn-helix domain-containing protein [Balneolaceae bacterium]
MKNLPASKRLVVNDLLFAEYKCPLSETRYDMWTHHNYFVYVIKGKKKWSSRDGEVLAREGDCIFVKKGAHSIYQYFDDEFCSLFMFVPDEFIRDTLLENRVALSSDNHDGSLPPIIRVQTNEMLKAYFLSFLSYITNADNSNNKLAEMKFRELILVIASGSGNSKVAHYFSGLCKRTRPSLQSVMESNFNYPMSLEEYARLSGRSLSAFKREFRKVYNTTPGRWLTQKRLDFGRYLLDQTGKSVTEVVLDCGFKNLSHFSRAYKEKFGEAPLRHKKTSEQKV